MNRSRIAKAGHSRRVFRRAAFGPSLMIAVLLPWAAESQEPEKAASSTAPQPDFKILYWYAVKDPIRTFQYRAYDVRKGRYHAKEVADWLQLIETRYPHYEAYVRDIRLDRFRGKTEAEKLQAAVQDQLERVVVVSTPWAVPLGPTIPGRPTLATRPPWIARPGPKPGLGMPSAPSFPVPMPFPRPHP